MDVIFRQTIQDGWQHEQPDHGLRRADPWEVAPPQEKVEVKLGCAFQVRGVALRIDNSSSYLAIRAPGLARRC